MAVKRLGRLRQWADEVINAKDKATLTGEARELEQEIEVRKEGLQRWLAAEQYHKSISKKKLSLALDDPEKFLPREAFGISMAQHGEDFAEDSLLGQALVSFGRAFCNVATAQEALGRTLASSFIIALQRFLDQIKDYDAERKKLETRRLNKDAAMKHIERLENNKKVKEKDRRDAEEELEKSGFRYDEAEADVQARIDAIQKNEIDQIRELGSLLDSELNYAEQYAQILRDVKDNWPGKQQIAKMMEPRRPIGPMHDFARESAELPRPKMRSRASSKARPRSRSPSPGSASSEVDDEPSQPRSRKGSVRSRTGSVRSRKRSDSQTTTGSAVEAVREKKEKEEKKKGGWSVWGRNSAKKDREQFASLHDGADGSDSSDLEGASRTSAQVPKSTSVLSLGKWPKSQQNNASPRIPALGTKTRGGEPERPRIVRAVSDYLGSTDELSFRTGDEIVVIGEVIDGWMMGQLGTKKGLFPTVYTEPIAAVSRRAVPTPPVVPIPPLIRRKSSSRTGSDMTTDSPSGSRQTLVETDAPTPPRFGLRRANAEDDNDASHPFGDHHATTHDTGHELGHDHETPVSAAHGGGYGYNYDSESLAESAADDSEYEHASLVRRRASDDDGFVNHRNDNGNDNSTVTSTSSGPSKKVPPPLPRRQTDVRKAPPPPPPPRRPDVRASPQPPTYGLLDGQTGDCANFAQAGETRQFEACALIRPTFKVFR
ncbi:hypothetical protein B0F90DRAFT_1818303 [Multifurca ochricompacta]|uniref:SH3 domain-containing protein n=1 Tax=Multifurca ochricompacta TaxID=376703 RepID=A0AAD4M3D7_9AGAM|nr:hypothetical protein B0F90DRAFT_1818303 [Multifurca ochricompacta]